MTNRDAEQQVTRKPRRPNVRIIGYLSFFLGLIALLLLAASILSFRAWGWSWPQAHNLFNSSVWIAGVGVLLGIIGFIVRQNRRQNNSSVIFLGVILSLPIVAVGATFEIAARTSPPINDISTDIDDPPVFWFTETPSSYPLQNAVPQRLAYPDVHPLELPVSVDQAFDAVLSLVQSRGWRILSANPAENQIEAIAASRIFGFEDEVAIRVSALDSGVRIDMRSRSRLGRNDRGVNAKRIRIFLSDLEARAKN